jgi:hypothetical protein
MRALTQTERNRRRIADTGHHDELVYFTGRGGTYHVDNSCARLDQSSTSSRSLTRGEALDRTRRVPCLHCTVPDLRKESSGNTRPRERYAKLIEAEQRTKEESKEC